MTVYNYHVSIKVQIGYNIWGGPGRKKTRIDLEDQKPFRDIQVVIFPVIKIIELHIKF